MDIKKERKVLNTRYIFSYYSTRIKTFSKDGTKRDTLLKAYYFKCVNMYNPGSSWGSP